MKIMTMGSWKGPLGAGLAPRELEATLWAAADLTAKEIARLMGITPKSVSKRLDDARFKLGARTVRGLVLEAFKRGLISFANVATPDPQQHEQAPHDGVFIA
jgi:DNA-binding CsgD family transcriptional regulator